MFIRAKKRGSRTYLQIVENHREGKKVTQTVRATLGRLDVLISTGKLDSLLRSGLRFSEKLLVLDAHSKDECTTTDTSRVGAVLLCEKLWRDCRIGTVLSSFLAARGYQYSLERVIFIVVLSRLFSPGSDRATLRWMRDYWIAGAAGLGLHHFYRAMGWLGEPVKSEKGKREFGKNTVALYRKDLIEEALFCLRRDLFTRMELVFFDTTSLYFEGEGGERIGQRGKSKDHRPDLKQMVVGIVLDDKGNPVCSELLPGNTADVKSLIPVAQRLRERFGVQDICIVADRGMISATTIEEIESMEGWHYILGARMRTVKEVRDEVLSRAGRFREVRAPRETSKDPAPLKVKDVNVGEHRYIICLNEEEARKAQHVRRSIVESLQRQIETSDKNLVGNKGYRRYLKPNGNHFEIDKDKIAEEERYDGKYVLRTDTTMSAESVALKYKQLWTVETIFRTMKSTMETRPIFHKCDDTIRGHVFCSFLALVLRKRLMDRLEAKGHDIEWAHIIQDVNEIAEVTVEHGGKQFTIRTEPKGVAGKVMQAAGVALPPVLREKKKCGTTPVPNS